MSDGNCRTLVAKSQGTTTHMTISRRSVVGGLSVFAATRPALAQTPPLVFTAIPDQDETRLVERFSAYAKYFEAKLGIPVKYLPVKSYPAAVTAFTNNQVQFAWFGGFTGVQAVRAVPNSQTLAQGAEDAAFTSVMIANTATGLQPSKDLPKAIAGRTFTFGARASTSGRVFPEHFIRLAFPGKSPEEIFNRVGFSGDHSRTVQLVQTGAFEVGILDSIVWKTEVKAGTVDPKLVSVIWESPPFPDYHWVARGDLDKVYGAGFTQKIQDTILGINDPALLTIFARSKFIPAKNEDYKVIEEVAKLVGLFN
jgi:phosphonate transport system substrate-binding protein